jgi:hypothetical protein
MPTGVMSDLWREKSAFTHFPKLILEAKRRIKVPISKHMDGDDSIHRGKIDIYISIFMAFTLESSTWIHAIPMEHSFI